MDKRVLRVGKRVLQVGEEYYEWPGKQYHNIMNTTLNIYLFILTLRCVKLMKNLISLSVNWCITLLWQGDKYSRDEYSSKTHFTAILFGNFADVSKIIWWCQHFLVNYTWGLFLYLFQTKFSLIRMTHSHKSWYIHAPIRHEKLRFSVG